MSRKTSQSEAVKGIRSAFWRAENASSDADANAAMQDAVDAANKAGGTKKDRREFVRAWKASG